MPRYIEKVESLTLPVIPLRGVVAFPSIPVNFELEREISKKACQAALASNMLVFLLTQKDTSVDDPSDNDFYKTGCVAQIKQTLTKNQDGNIRVIAEGYCRAEVVKLKRDKGYITADVLSKTLTAETGVLDIRSEALINESLNTLEEMLQFHPTISGEYMTTASSISNPGLLADFIASSVFVRYQDKAAVLEMFDPLKRLEKTIVLMESEMKLLRTEVDIQRKVKEAIDENQRDYYLREQLKAIESELGIDEDADELQKKMAKMTLPEEVRREARERDRKARESSDRLTGSCRNTQLHRDLP